MKQITSISATPELLVAVKQLAKAQGLTFSAFVTTLLTKALREEEEYRRCQPKEEEVGPPGRPPDSPRLKRVKEIARELGTLVGGVREMYRNQFGDVTGEIFLEDRGAWVKEIADAVEKQDLERLEGLRLQKPWKERP